MFEILNAQIDKTELVELYPKGDFTAKAFVMPVVVDDRYIMTYGGSNGSADTNFLNIYDTVTNTITEKAVTNADVRHSYGAVLNSTNDGISVIWSYDPVKHNSYLVLPQTARAAMPGSLLPTGITPRQEPAICRIGNYAYIFGGWKQDDTMLNDTLRWNIDTDTIVDLKATNPPSARRATGSCAHEGKFYVVSGTNHPGGNDTFNDFWCYDPATNAWTQLSDTPFPVRITRAVSYRGYIYIYGGMSYNVQLDQLARYSVADDTWEILPLDNAVKMHGHALVVVRGDLYVLWGIAGGSISKRIFMIRNA